MPESFNVDSCKQRKTSKKESKKKPYKSLKFREIKTKHKTHIRNSQTQDKKKIKNKDK